MDAFLYSLEFDVAAELVAMLEQHGAEFLLSPRVKEQPNAYTGWLSAQTKAILHMDKLKAESPKSAKEDAEKQLAIRRVKNILRVGENFNSRRDLLAGISLEVSPGLTALEKIRYSAMENPPEAKAEQRGQNIRPTKKRGEITQKDAAKLCGVSESTIYNWEKGVRCPDRYPGRLSALAFKMWAETYKSEELIRRLATGAERARPMDPKHLDEAAYKSAFDED